MHCHAQPKSRHNYLLFNLQICANKFPGKEDVHSFHSELLAVQIGAPLPTHPLADGWTLVSLIRTVDLSQFTGGSEGSKVDGLKDLLVEKLSLWAIKRVAQKYESISKTLDPNACSLVKKKEDTSQRSSIIGSSWIMRKFGYLKSECCGTWCGLSKPMEQMQCSRINFLWIQWKLQSLNCMSGI